MTNHKFKPVKKDRLFYNRYEYCIGFYLDEVSCLRVLDHAHIDDFIHRRQQWREIAQQRWINGKQNHGIIMGRRWNNITEKTITDLHALADELLSSKADFKLVVSLNQGYVYTNEIDLIKRLDMMPELDHKSYAHAVIGRPKDTVKLKNSRFAFRTYFKVLHLTSQQKEQLEHFLHNQRDQVRLGPALARWFDIPFNRTQDYFFIDHHSQSWLTMLGPVLPGGVRKTMNIITDKQNTMAKINEQTLVITVSQLVKDDAPTQALLSQEVVAQLEAVVGELAGAGTLVEIKQA